MSEAHDIAFGEWSDEQHESAAGYVRELGRLTEWRDAALAADRADYERAAERTWRAFYHALGAAHERLARNSVQAEEFWLAEVKPGHRDRPDGPPGAVPDDSPLDPDGRGNVRVVYPGAVPADADLGFTPGKAGPGDPAGPPGMLP